MKLTVVIAFCLLLALPVFADITPTRPAIPTGSWTQTFNETYGTSFTTIETFMKTPGITFGDPLNVTGMNAFTDASWSSDRINPQYVFASGNASTNLNWNYTFSSDMNTPFTFDAYILDGSKNILEAVIVNWDGTAWSYDPATLNADSLAHENTAPVPEPASLFLIGSGLFAVARRIRRA